MVSSALGLGALCGLIFSLPGALAGFSSSANNNIEIYWGQNSVNRVGGQQRLSAYCSNTPLNVIPLAFLNVIKNPTSVNFANAGDNCTVFAGTQLLSCPQIEADIKTCQAAGKTITLSIGGATYTEGGFTSSSEASTWADNLWAMFGPVQSGSSALRPFGTAVVDGFDLDLEATSQNMGPFAVQLRNRMNSATAAGGKKYFLSAAPQCPFPDAAMGAMLDAVVFDYVSVQFYNNYCGATSFVPGAATQNNFNFATWDTWARSKTPPVKVLLGLPGSTSAAGSGYVSGSQLSAVIAYCKQFSTFGGVMFWDMSQVYSNSGFLDSVVSYLGGSNPPPPPPPTSTTAPPPPTTLMTVTRTSSTPTPTPTGTLVQQWGQCGGIGYTGSTQCAPPYSCNYLSQWWAQCQ
ncbi:glycoside hydrolase superfamily [Lasiosphaeria miniovina]|uniref:chitinase n=1 Tax=Lasiosphaeria miniovina TaxID=1954250 RepID=A0AA40ATB0_9PEZI|nr:glycoside hydrolase superfamily [Lasiosphaeria miniovina]KAK0721633.1 glycoside hydrolase superfamily [Lasiosphaeria miniovina]